MMGPVDRSSARRSLASGFRRLAWLLWSGLAMSPAAGADKPDPLIQPDRLIWIEAEQYAQSNYPHLDSSDMGRPGLLSGGSWLIKVIAAEEVQKLVPDEGIELTYPVQVEQAGTYDLWARVGWFTARADFQWRLGDGPWTTVPRTLSTTNLMQVGYFTEASWARLGPVKLEPGNTALRIRYPKVIGSDKPMLLALDCFAFNQGKFTPEGPFKPGDTYAEPIDQQAAKQVFQLPDPIASARAEVKLNGLWQVARYDDPDMDQNTYEPIRALPGDEEYTLRWMGFEVPGSPWDKDALVFGHRLIYRTRVEVSAAHQGRGFKLHFSGTNWIASVFVNGRLAGTHQGVWVPWDLDISQFIAPGQENEIAVAIKGTYYALDAKAMGKDTTLNELRNQSPHNKADTRWVAPVYPGTQGDGDGYLYGIVNPVTLVSLGNTYTEDVFIKPSVQHKRLQIEVTVRNTDSLQRTFQIVCQAVNPDDEQVEQTFGPVDVTVPGLGSETVTVEGAWENPRLWWPKPDADLYLLRTTVSENGGPLDVHQELFGFREVTIQGTGIYINGVRRNFWNWADVQPRQIDNPQQWADAWQAEQNRFLNFSHGRRITQALRSREERLEFYDRHGIPGRLCTMIDGSPASYQLGQIGKDDNGNPLLVPNNLLWDNFRRHMAQVVKAYRNHPSVILYQVASEQVWLNGTTRYESTLATIEQLMDSVCEAGRQVDPTRPYTVGGAGDLSGRLPIHSLHNPQAAVDRYPENAYALDAYADPIEPWPRDRNKPWLLDESSPADNLAVGAYVAGDRAFRGPDDVRAGRGQWLRMLYGGYRWAGVAGFFPPDNLSDNADVQEVLGPLCAIPRKQTSRLFAGQENRLLFKVMNDTLSNEPVGLQWSYTIDGKTIAAGEASLDIEPGFGQEHTIIISAPRTEKRLEGILELTVSQPGSADFVDERLVPVLPKARSAQPATPLYVLDRQGNLGQFLSDMGLKFERIDRLDAIAGRQGLLLVGSDTLTAAEASGTELFTFASGGGRVICLEQTHPPQGMALPVPLSTSEHFGGYAHPRAIGTAMFADLGKDDLIDWQGDGPTYKNAYQRLARGVRVLAQCGAGLEHSPLVEVPCNQGLILLCQLRVAEKLGVEPAAEVLLRNFIDAYGHNQPANGIVAVYSPRDELLPDKVRQTGVLTRTVGSISEALNPKRFKVAVIPVSGANLLALNSFTFLVQEFEKAGGWIVLMNLEPEAIQRFNRLVGADHMLRAFRIERVTLQNPDHPLAATLGNRDLALLSSRPMQSGGDWISGDTFSYVIDGLDFAPFTIPPGGPRDANLFRPTFDDQDPFNFVNGMLSSDSWRYIRQIWIPEQGPEPLVFRLRRPEMLDTIKIWNNDAYWTIKDLDILIDRDEENPIRAVLPDSSGLTSIKLPQPRRVGSTITLAVRSWRQRPLRREGLRLIGIDNVQFLRPESPAEAVFIDSVGGLVAFPRGQGGMFLCQLKFTEEEPRPENNEKKLHILGTLLQNMGAARDSASATAEPGG